MSLLPLLDRLRLDPKFMTNVAAWERLPAREAKYAPFPDALDPRLAAALRARGLSPLYTHQAEAVGAALRGENVVVVTGTASGKTLCYNLPVLQSFLADSESCALYLFPTKALAQDQAAELGEFVAVLENELRIRNGELGDTTRNSQFTTHNSSFAIRLYDGDTPQSHRAAIRREARLLITN
ncbi:MAG: DEAD/DEAH box helicase, partial [Chloroflexi bacterium]|nr:DEAD/DEAH box helicase [Chloroflexota bacterium]